MIVLVYQSILVIQMTETNGGASISNVSHADDKAQSSAATTTTVSRSQDRRYSAIEKQFYLDRLVNGGLSLKELAKETGIGRNRLRSWGADLKAGTLVDDPILNTSMHVDVDTINDDDDYISSKIQVKSVDDIIFAPREVYYSDIDGALFDWYQRELKTSKNGQSLPPSRECFLSKIDDLRPTVILPCTFTDSSNYLDEFIKRHHLSSIWKFWKKEQSTSDRD